MADIERHSEAVWHGNLREGHGHIDSGSGILKEMPYTFASRFEDGKGTNPEELIAAAHAACFSMFLSNILSRKEFNVTHVRTRAICHLTPQQPSGFKITKITLETRGKVEDLEEDEFKTAAEEAKRGCPVSQALSALEIVLDAQLEK